MTGHQYLKVRLSELASHGRRCWLWRWKRWTLCIVREVQP
jgi:hypothetical protein